MSYQGSGKSYFLYMSDIFLSLRYFFILFVAALLFFIAVFVFYLELVRS